MYRVTKVLNHNAIIAVKDNTATEYLILGKGIGFGKKISESVEISDNETVYSLRRTGAF